MDRRRVTVEINGRPYSGEVEPRLLLSDFIRHGLGLTGTHVGCEHGVCGACTILVDGAPMRACLMLAVQANGRQLSTVEGLAAAPDRLSPLQEAFRAHHALQCGFCTPGMIMSAIDLVEKTPGLTEEQIRHGLEGNLCRCTGYHNIVKAIAAAAKTMGR